MKTQAPCPVFFCVEVRVVHLLCGLYEYWPIKSSCHISFALQYVAKIIEGEGECVCFRLSILDWFIFFLVSLFVRRTVELLFHADHQLDKLDPFDPSLTE